MNHNTANAKRTVIFTKIGQDIAVQGGLFTCEIPRTRILLLILLTSFSLGLRLSVTALARPQANGQSLYPPISYDGTHVAFYSEASNLVSDDYNGVGDIFIREFDHAADNAAAPTERISVSSAGCEGNGVSTWPSMSRNGDFVLFTSAANNFFSNDVNNQDDVFVRDRISGTTELVSVSSSGEPANNASYTYFPAISADGRFATFLSLADNLVAGDINNTWDVFVRDRKEHTTIRITDGNAPSLHAVISGNGRYVAFHSFADDLVENDTNGVSDVFLHDLLDGTTVRVSVNEDGDQGNGFSDRAAITFDGALAFTSEASNLVKNDTNETQDVYFRTLDGTIKLVSVSSNGEQMEAVGPQSDPKAVASPDGNYILFRSFASNLVPDDTNNTQDIFVRDLVHQITERVSVSSTGVQANGISVHHGISEGGRFVVFSSEADNLVQEDTNGFSDIFLRDRLLGKTILVSAAIPEPSAFPVFCGTALFLLIIGRRRRFALCPRPYDGTLGPICGKSTPRSRDNFLSDV